MPDHEKWGHFNRLLATDRVGSSITDSSVCTAHAVGLAKKHEEEP